MKKISISFIMLLFTALEFSANAQTVIPSIPVQDNFGGLPLTDPSTFVPTNYYSIDGKQMKNIPCTAGENRLDISAFPKGLYLSILKIDGQTETFKIIKK
jgi:hypothetical protein